APSHRILCTPSISLQKGSASPTRKENSRRAFGHTPTTTGITVLGIGTTPHDSDDAEPVDDGRPLRHIQDAADEVAPGKCRRFTRVRIVQTYTHALRRPRFGGVFASPFS